MKSVKSGFPVPPVLKISLRLLSSLALSRTYSFGLFGSLDWKVTHAQESLDVHRLISLARFSAFIVQH